MAAQAATDAAAFALQRHVCRGDAFESLTAWLERNGLLVQGLGPGTALQLAEVHPQQGTLCRRLGGGSVVMAEADEEPDALTLSVVAPRAPADAHAALGAVLAHWAAQHPQLPVCFGPALLLQARSEVRLPQGLFIAFGTRRKGLLYQVSSPGWGPQRRVRIRSIGKSLACMVALRLAQQGALGLGDRVSQHLPSWDRPDKRDITLTQLLNHVSGLECVPDSHPASTRPDISMAEAAAMLAEVPVVAPAGQVFRYWGGGYQVLGAVVEAVCGKSWHDVFQEQVAQLLGLTGTAFMNGSTAAPAPRNPDIATSCVSTPHDMMRYVAMLARGGRAEGGGERFISREAFDMLLADQAPGADPSGCSMSLRMLRPELGPALYLGGLQAAGVISGDQAEAAKQQAVDVRYSLGGWPSRHATSGHRNFTTLGYFNSLLHVAGADTDDPSWFVTLSHSRYNTLWQHCVAELTQAAQAAAAAATVAAEAGAAPAS